MTYGERFKECLGMAGKTRKGVAKVMGISIQGVGHIVNGKTKSATASNNAAAARYFGVDPTWLATGQGLKFGDSGPGHYVAEPTPLRRAAPSTPQDLLGQLRTLLRPCPESLRVTVASLLQRLALAPDDDTLPDQIVALLRSAPRRKSSGRQRLDALTLGLRPHHLTSGPTGAIIVNFHDIKRR